jgi:hypothetical protein
LKRRFLDFLLDFLIAFLRLTNFLLNCAKCCFTGLSFLPPFLTVWKLDFSLPSLSYLWQSFIFCVVCMPPCFLHRWQCSSVQAFLGTLAVGLVPGHLLLFLPLAEAFFDCALAFSWVHMRSTASGDIRSKHMSNGIMPFLRRLHWSCHEVDTSEAHESPVQPW